MFKTKANFQHWEQLVFNHIRKTHLGRQAATTETDTTIATTTTTIINISNILGKFAPFHTGGGHRRKPLILNGKGTPTTLKVNPLF